MGYDHERFENKRLRRLELLPGAGVPTSGRKGFLFWPGSDDAAGKLESGSDCSEAIILPGRLMLACVENGSKRKQFIDSIAHLADGSVCRAVYKGKFRQGEPDMADSVHALAELLTDADDGDLFIIDVDVPYYSRILDEGTPEDDTDGDVVDDWNIVLRLMERLLTAGRDVSFVIVTTAFDDRLLPGTLLDHAYARIGVGCLGGLQRLTLFDDPSRYEAGLDRGWLPGDPLVLQVEADGVWMGQALLEAPEATRSWREQQDEDTTSGPVVDGAADGWGEFKWAGRDQDAAIVRDEQDAEKWRRLVACCRVAASVAIVIGAIVLHNRRKRR